MRREYPSDISREQFEAVRELLENSRKRTRPRKVDLYDVFCGILYLLKGGVQWRMLPGDYPKWRTVHEYFAQWSRRADERTPSLLEQALKKSGWAGGTQIGTERKNNLPDRGCPKRQKHRHCGAKGV
jgi:transposase